MCALSNITINTYSENSPTVGFLPQTLEYAPPFPGGKNPAYDSRLLPAPNATDPQVWDWESIIRVPFLESDPNAGYNTGRSLCLGELFWRR
jgi:hypothetical protein